MAFPDRGVLGLSPMKKQRSGTNIGWRRLDSRFFAISMSTTSEEAVSYWTKINF
jgi:hypothetical protein